MWQILIYSIIQSLLLVAGQVFLKIGLARMAPFGWTWTFWRSFLVNWQFALCGVLYSIAAITWMYIIKKFPFSVAYPMISLSYVFGMFAAILIFNEDVNMYKWIGIALIVLGCLFIAK